MVRTIAVWVTTSNPGKKSRKLSKRLRLRLNTNETVGLAHYAPGVGPTLRGGGRPADHAARTAVATGVSVAIVGLLQPASGATFWSTSIGPQVAGSYS
jgi:hypothetical protein